MRSASGFSFVEAMVSVAVLAIIASTSVFALRSSQEADQLNTAARVLASDLRSYQSRALTSQNVKICANTSGKMVTCELDTSGCSVPASCAAQPPAAFGVHVVANASVYSLFVEPEPTTADWAYTGTAERVMDRDLSQAGAPNVIISAIDSGTPSDVAFERQNGSAVINGCRASQGCVSSSSITMTLQHTKSGVTRTVTLNSVTGRVSIY